MGQRTKKNSVAHDAGSTPCIIAAAGTAEATNTTLAKQPRPEYSSKCSTRSWKSQHVSYVPCVQHPPGVHNF